MILHPLPLPPPPEIVKPQRRRRKKGGHDGGAGAVEGSPVWPPPERRRMVRVCDTVKVFLGFGGVAASPPPPLPASEVLTEAVAPESEGVRIASFCPPRTVSAGARPPSAGPAFGVRLLAFSRRFDGLFVGGTRVDEGDTVLLGPPLALTCGDGGRPAAVATACCCSRRSRFSRSRRPPRFRGAARSVAATLTPLSTGST